MGNVLALVQLFSLSLQFQQKQSSGDSGTLLTSVQGLKDDYSLKTVSLMYYNNFMVDLKVCSIVDLIVCSMVDLIVCSMVDLKVCSMVDLIVCSMVDLIVCSMGDLIVCSMVDLNVCSIRPESHFLWL